MILISRAALDGLIYFYQPLSSSCPESSSATKVSKRYAPKVDRGRARRQRDDSSSKGLPSFMMLFNKIDHSVQGI
jgi:hypothetical protein